MHIVLGVWAVVSAVLIVLPIFLNGSLITVLVGLISLILCCLCWFGKLTVYAIDH